MVEMCRSIRPFQALANEDIDGISVSSFRKMSSVEYKCWLLGNRGGCHALKGGKSGLIAQIRSHSLE